MCCEGSRLSSACAVPKGAVGLPRGLVLLEVIITMQRTWIEAALNGPWSRNRQPGIPDTVEAIVADGIACAAAGACIIHAHAYDGGGPQTFDIALEDN